MTDKLLIEATTSKLRKYIIFFGKCSEIKFLPVGKSHCFYCKRRLIELAEKEYGYHLQCHEIVSTYTPPATYTPPEIEASAPQGRSIRSFILLLGDSEVGKSMLFRRWRGLPYDPSIIKTLGADIVVKQHNIPNRPDESLYYYFWDLSGASRFEKLLTLYFAGAAGVIFMFDVTHRASFQHLDNWVLKAQMHMQNSLRGAILVGTKSDLRQSKATADQVTLEEAKSYANQLTNILLSNGEAVIPYIETSAKEDTHIEEPLDKLATILSNQYPHG